MRPKPKNWGDFALLARIGSHFDRLRLPSKLGKYRSGSLSAATIIPVLANLLLLVLGRFD